MGKPVHASQPRLLLETLPLTMTTCVQSFCFRLDCNIDSETEGVQTAMHMLSPFSWTANTLNEKGSGQWSNKKDVDPGFINTRIQGDTPHPSTRGLSIRGKHHVGKYPKDRKNNSVPDLDFAKINLNPGVFLSPGTNHPGVKMGKPGSQFCAIPPRL